MTETRGVAFFAYNTNQIDYIKLAVTAARYVKHNMVNNKTCIITDKGTWDWVISSEFSKWASEAFDEVVITTIEHDSNQRTHYDSPWAKFTSEFKNSNKHLIYEYTPFDKTLMLDIDYIVQNDSLDYIFDSDEAVAMFQSAESLVGQPPAATEQWLKPAGIPMAWSTVVYFDKTLEFTELFFDTWSHVRDNYEFYKFLYGFSGNMYRTDFCVSIANHILNGMGPGELIGTFDDQKMINMSQHDGIAKINSINDWVYLINDKKENWENTVTRIASENVHVMNKRALDRVCLELMHLFDEVSSDD